MKKIVRNCWLCNKIIENSLFMLCTNCHKDTEQIWKYIKKCPFVTIKQISVATNIRYEKVEKMIQRGMEVERKSNRT